MLPLPQPVLQAIVPLSGWPVDTEVSVLRSDLVHPAYGGNKYYKLAHSLVAAAEAGLPVLTFGGAFSNHLAATAAAARDAGLRAIGVVRGEELHAASNEVLAFAADCGMRLIFVARSDYRRRDDPQWLAELQQRFGPAFVIPEGGTNAHAVVGCAALLGPHTHLFEHVVCAAGTGGTLAGLAAGAAPHQHVTGIAVVNDGPRIRERVTQLLKPYPTAAPWMLREEFTCGGYASSTPAYADFLNRAEALGLPLDRVYTGKLFYAVEQLLLSGAFNGEPVLVLHSGGYRFGH